MLLQNVAKHVQQLDSFIARHRDRLRGSLDAIGVRLLHWTLDITSSFVGPFQTTESPLYRNVTISAVVPDNAVAQLAPLRCYSLKVGDNFLLRRPIPDALDFGLHLLENIRTDYRRAGVGCDDPEALIHRLPNTAETMPRLPLSEPPAVLTVGQNLPHAGKCPADAKFGQDTLPVQGFHDRRICCAGRKEVVEDAAHDFDLRRRPEYESSVAVLSTGTFPVIADPKHKSFRIYDSPTIAIAGQAAGPIAPVP